MMLNLSRLLCLALAPLALASAVGTQAAQPKADALSLPPPMLMLSPEDKRRLDKGKVLFETVREQGVSWPVVMFRVDADASQIWKVISDFERYPDRVDSVAHSKVYRRSETSTFVHFRIEHWLTGDVNYYMRHVFSGPQNSSAGAWARWGLDSAERSDFKVARGFWRVQPTLNPKVSYVFYSGHVQADSLGGSVSGLFVRSSLRAGSFWVKAVAEGRGSQTPQEDRELNRPG